MTPADTVELYQRPVASSYLNTLSMFRMELTTIQQEYYIGFCDPGCDIQTAIPSHQKQHGNIAGHI